MGEILTSNCDLSRTLAGTNTWCSNQHSKIFDFQSWFRNFRIHIKGIMFFEIKYLKKLWSAHKPKMAMPDSTGSYLFSVEDKKLKPRSVTAVSIHLQVEIPTGYYRHNLPTSGLACHHFIGVGGRVIDSDFRREVNVTMFNHLNKPFEVRVGDRIAQVVFQRREIPNFVKCDELSKTNRVLGGFGSTGT